MNSAPNTNMTKWTMSPKELVVCSLPARDQPLPYRTRFARLPRDSTHRDRAAHRSVRDSDRRKCRPIPTRSPRPRRLPLQPAPRRRRIPEPAARRATQDDRLRRRKPEVDLARTREGLGWTLGRCPCERRETANLPRRMVNNVRARTIPAGKHRTFAPAQARQRRFWNRGDPHTPIRIALVDRNARFDDVSLVVPHRSFRAPSPSPGSDGKSRAPSPRCAMPRGRDP